MPKISIITPVYCDQEIKVQWLAETIESVQAQTFDDWEMILLNDQSPLSLDPVKLKFYDDSRLRWIDNAKNFGPAATRNTAVALAQAECILPLDSDDLLATEDALEAMYGVWSQDTTKTIYGNLQVYKEIATNVFKRDAVISLAAYSFENAMNLGGAMPVTCMHSKEAHLAAGGWKAELDKGREDVEYWIACGKAGYCGRKIDHTTLLYRKHEMSRDYNLRFVLGQVSQVQQQIRAMHADIYIRGEFPMACCGKGGNQQSAPQADPLAASQGNLSKGRVTTELPGVDKNLWIWKQYIGQKRGSFEKISHRTQIRYKILGTGHTFPIHRDDERMFNTALDRFATVQPPQETATEQDPPPRRRPTIVEARPPQLSTIVRPDPIAAGQRDFAVQARQEPEYSPPPQTVPTLASLNLGITVTKALEEAGYTVDKLTRATVGDLMEVKGIGRVTARKILDAVNIAVA